MKTNDEQLETFYNYISANYNDLKKIYKQFCFLNHIDWNEDTFQDTIVKVAEIIKKKGLKKDSEKDIANYFFKAFKFNLYQAHLQESKRRIDKNVELPELNVAYKEYDEEEEFYSEKITKKCEALIRDNFSELDYAIFRLRYLFKFNDDYLTFKDIKRITKVPDCRRRLVQMNKFLRENSDTILKKDC